MDTDWSVELSSSDDVLEFPWSSPDGSQLYFDLLRQPERLAEILETSHYPELGELLRMVNRPQSPWLTAKCDVWLDDEIREIELVYDTKIKLCSYVDLIARENAARFSFERHECWVKSAARALSTDNGLRASCEFIVRRCWFHSEAASGGAGNDAAACEDTVPGFYVTFYLSGYGDEESQARARWAEGLRLVTATLVASAP